MDFLPVWLRIIRNCNIDNTYKMAWAKALTEIALETDIDEIDTDEYEITLEAIARKVIKCYWDQTIFFDLVQGSNPLKPPRIITITKALIKEYQEKTESVQPVKYMRSNVETICKNEYERTLKLVVSALKQDVSYRFTTLDGRGASEIYKYERGSGSLLIPTDNLRVLKENFDISFEAINFRWAQILENFSHAPRICKKVRIIDVNELRRTQLARFKNYLEYENPNHKCFICEEEIHAGELSIDHVIPWSFLYSDDIWNLVFTHKNCNSSKSNIVPDESSIAKLQERNKRLLEAFEKDVLADKQVSELQFAIENNLVRKFWISCQG